MGHAFEEMVIPYKREQLIAWKAGDKSLIPWFLEDLDVIYTQPECHFGEIFVLNHFHQTGGWLGFRFYSLGTREQNDEWFMKGRRKVEELIPADRLNAFRAERNKTKEGRKGYGEPDVFLYKPTGEVIFLQVKKQGDRTSNQKLICMAQIREILACGVGIVYLKSDCHKHAPKRYHIMI